MWAVGSVIASLILVAVFHVGSVSSIASKLGTFAAGVTNLTGLSIVSLDGYTGVFDVSGSGTGTQFQRMNGGTCYFAPPASTITASTSISIDCQGTAMFSTTAQSALTGVTTNDNVILTLSTTTAGTSNNSLGLVVEGASASSTAGYITVRLGNLTGTTFTWPTTGSASGTASYFVTK